MSTAHETTASAPITEPTTAHTETALPAASTTTEPTTIETMATVPAVDVPAEASTTAATEGTTAAGSAQASVEPIHHGALGYKAPGLVNSFRFSKRYFWFGEDEPVSTQNLNQYLRGEKPEIAHPTAAWSSQTGKGLLFYAKHADQKATPLGVLNLSEATDITKESFNEFSFKLHGHKHTFQTKSMQERDGWFVALQQTAEHAAGRREEMLSSSGYKDNMAQLGKPAALATAAAGTTPRKSVDAKPTEGVSRDNASSSSSSSFDAEGRRKAKKSKSKSRSVSRGKRASIFGSLLGKKEEHDEKKEEKAEKKDLTTETKPETATEAPVAGTAAPIDATAIAARVLDAPAEEIGTTTATETIVPAVNEPVTEAAVTPKGTTSREKPTKRGSIFGAFFEKVRSPTTEKKEHEVAPSVPPKDTETVPASTVDGTTETPAASTLPTDAGVTTTATEPTADVATPHKEKENFFGKFLHKEKAKTPTTEVPPTTTTETPFLTPTEGTEPSQPLAEKTEAPASTVSPPAATTNHTHDDTKEKRRTSFFGGFSGSMRKKSGTHEDSTNGEPKSSPLPAKLGGLFRNPSKAIKGNKEAKKEATTPAKVDEASQTPATATSATEPAHVGTDGPIGAMAEDTNATRGQQSIGDVVPEAVTVGHGQAQSASPAVHATA